MNEPSESSAAIRAPGEPLPRATTVRHKWKFPFVWVVPVVSALVAGYLIFQRVHEFGPEISIQFQDVSGLREDQTPIKYRGVTVGKVTGIALAPGGHSALVKGRLRRPVIPLVRDGSVFWIVRPEFSIANVSGLGTIIAGPHIELLPAGDKPRLEFIGLETTPATFNRPGLKIILVTDHLSSLKPGSPVYYRGIDVGAVEGYRLSTNAASVDIHVFIEERYTNLVRGDSKFWDVSGLNMKFGLFRGAEINVESLRSLANGGISFATPTDFREGPAMDGMMFRLYAEPKPEWLEWNPKILVGE